MVPTIVEKRGRNSAHQKEKATKAPEEQARRDKEIEEDKTRILDDIRASSVPHTHAAPKKHF